MSGLFGGLLSAIDFLGGIILFLLIGKKAWVTKYPARGIRLFIASIAIGIILSTLIYFFDSSVDLIPVMVASVIVVSVLEVLNIVIKV